MAGRLRTIDARTLADAVLEPPGYAVKDLLVKGLHILAGADIHFRGDAPINAVADADIFHPTAVIHDQVQLLPGLLRGVADLKLPQAAGFLLLQVARRTHLEEKVSV